MKKFLHILILILFLNNNAYSNTPTEKFVIEKLIDEFAHCSVYYKFISKSIKKKGELNNKEKLYVDQLNLLSEESEKSMLFYLTLLNTPKENIQEDIEKIYKSFLDIVGYDYSKIKNLNNKYLEYCINSLADPDARMFYWDREYLKSKIKQNKKKDNDLTDTRLFLTDIKLLCLSNLKEDPKNWILAYHFINSKEVNEYSYSQNNYDLVMNTKDYKSLGLAEIHIADRKDYSKLVFIRNKIFISRKSLNLKFYNIDLKKWWNWWDCKVKDQNFDILNYLNSIKEKQMKEKLSKVSKKII